MSETNPDPADVHTGTDRVELTEDEREAWAEYAHAHGMHVDFNRQARNGFIDGLRAQATHAQALVDERDYIAQVADRLEAERDAARAELAAANAKISKWAEDYKRLAHDCGGTEIDRQALAARCAELERMTVNVPADIASENADLRATLDRVTALADSRMAGLRGFIVVKELVDALGGSYDYTGCGQWDGTPGAGYCCDLPVGHAGPHHADHHWPRAALTPEGTE